MRLKPCAAILERILRGLNASLLRGEPVPLRLRLLLLLATAFVSLPAKAQQALTTVPQEKLDIVKVLTAQEAAWNRGDIEGFVEAYKNSPDILFISGIVDHGFAGAVERYKREYPSKAAMGLLGFSELEVHLLDEHFAVVVGRYTVERGKHSGGNVTGLFSYVMEKTDKGWKIIVDHTTE
jgi:ketosteroid isomerase-like protein